MLAIPNIPYLTPILCVTSLVTGLYGGYKVTSNYYDAKQAKADEAVIEQLVHQASVDRKVIENYQIDVRTLQNAYIELGREAREVKITTSKCTLTDAGARLWDESLLGETNVSKTSSGTLGNRGTDPAGEIDFAEAFQNKILNDQQCNKMREKIESLKKWDMDTYGD